MVAYNDTQQHIHTHYVYGCCVGAYAIQRDGMKVLLVYAFWMVGPPVEKYGSDPFGRQVRVRTCASGSLHSALGRALHNNSRQLVPGNCLKHPQLIWGY